MSDKQMMPTDAEFEHSPFDAMQKETLGYAKKIADAYDAKDMEAYKAYALDYGADVAGLLLALAESRKV